MAEEEVKESKENPELKSHEGLKKQETSDDEHSPRCVHEIPVSGTDSDDHSSSSSSTCSSSSTEKSINQRPVIGETYGLPWKSIVNALKKKSVRRFSTISLMASYELTTKSLRKKLARIRSADDAIDCDGIPLPKPSWRNFDYAELAAATNNFSPENMIGKGGHAEVYKGCLSDGDIVAVKRLNKKGDEEQDRNGDFLSELGIIAHIDHPNAAKMLGFGTDGGLHLVLQFSPNGSLSSLLHGSSETFEWSKRYKVAVGVAEGLKYLHHECQRRIIHRDIKASNILLTEDFEAQISDFGLAKWLPENWAYHVFFPIEGTFGYLAPEYFMHGIADEKTDVFAFGVLLLELITGRRAVDSSRQSLAMWAKPLLDENNVNELADPRLGDEYDPVEMKQTMLTASMCINHLPSKRPHMIRVVQLIRGENGPMEQKQKSIVGREVMLHASDMEDYTRTTYLNDLNRHMELVME